MPLSPEEKFIENIPGVVPEHPYEYFREMNDRDWKKHQKVNGMFTFHFGDRNMHLGHVISNFQQRCIDIQMAPTLEEAQKLRDSLALDQKYINEWATQMRSDEMEYALMQKEFAQAQLDAALSYTYVDYGKTKHNYYNILRGAINLIHITGGEESNPETLRNLLGEEMYEKIQNIQSVRRSFDQSVFRSEFNSHLSWLANDAFAEARKNWVMTDAQAKIISFYLTEWDTSDLRSLRSDFLERSKVFRGGVQLTILDIQTLYPRDLAQAA